MMKKKMITFTLCAAMALTMMACGKEADKTPDTSPNTSPGTSQGAEGSESTMPGGDSVLGGAENSGAGDNGNVGLVNPFADCATMEEAIELAGFDFTAPDAVEGYAEKRIQAMEGKLIQVNYMDMGENGENENGSGEAEDAGNTDGEATALRSVCIRKGVGDGDVSGDYNAYSETDTVTVGDLQVTMKGDDGKVSVAIWTDGEYTFSVTTNDAMDSDEITALIQNIK